MNTRLLKRVRDKILDNPTQVNMDQWYASYNAVEGAADPEGCGTAGCICGWAVALHDKKTLAEENHRIARSMTMNSSMIEKMERLGRKALGLTTPQAQRLFYANRDDKPCWPEDLVDRLDDAALIGSVEGYAQVVADRIDRFIKTKGQE